MRTRVRAAAFGIILLAGLAACGGGGVAVVIPDVPFLSFIGPTPNEPVVLPGVSFNLGGAVDQADSTLSLTHDADLDLVGLSISTPDSSVSFGASEVACTGSGACTAADATSRALVMSPSDLGWNYQTFGVWKKDLTAPGFQAGAISAGAITPSVALPVGITNAVFEGRARGFFINPTGTLFNTDADMSAITNFSSRNIQFSTINTFLADPNTPSLPTPAQELNLTGVWNYNLGTSQFSGDVASVNGMLGRASGRFYGPNAEEIGGIYSLTGGGATLFGGFGGKR